MVHYIDNLSKCVLSLNEDAGVSNENYASLNFDALTDDVNGYNKRYKPTNS